MARTFHKRPTHLFHHMRVLKTHKMSESVKDQLVESEVKPRRFNRVMGYVSNIPEPWDDKVNASAREYHNKRYWIDYRNAMNAPHYTRNRSCE